MSPSFPLCSNNNRVKIPSFESTEIEESNSPRIEIEESSIASIQLMKHSNSVDRTEEIQRIAQELETLTDRLNDLLSEESTESEIEQAQQVRQVHQARAQVQQVHQARAQAQQVRQVHREHQELREGERVVITNNYKGQRGTTGIIVHTTTHQVSIRIAGTNRIINKKKTNVRRI